jgi:hypothetical protein
LGCYSAKRRPGTSAGCGTATPLPEAYEALACANENDILIEGVKYINVPKTHSDTVAKTEDQPEPLKARVG